MKKKGLIIASLMILVLSFAFVGCDDKTEEKNPAEIPSALAQKIKDMGYTGTVYLPDNASYVGYDQETDGKLTIGWKDCSEATYDAYEAKWSDSYSVSARAIDLSLTKMKTLSKLGSTSGLIAFSPEGGTQGTLSLPPNSIVLRINKVEDED